jgi:hypothetical protein
MAQRRFPAHILQKIHKAISPPLTYLDAAATVVCIVRIILVITTLLHRLPSNVLHCLVRAISLAM